MRRGCQITLCFALLPLAALSSCSKQAPPATEVLRPVRAVQVFSTGGARVRKFSGVARAATESNISFKVAGTIQRRLLEVGSTVRRGQLLAELDPADFRLRVQDAEAALVQAKARQRNANADYERVRGLYENRNASKQDLDAARTAWESATASVESAEKRLELEKRQLEYTRLTAPIDGSIATCEVEVNENVRAGQTIYRLQSDSELEVDVAIPEILIAQVREGSLVTVTFDALPGRSIPGTVTEVGVAATATATTFPVTVRLNRADADIRSGMAAEVAFAFDAADMAERFIVPAVAVGEDREGRFVFVVAKGTEPGTGVVERRPVSIGDLSGDGIAVTAGLADGEFVVTAGVSKLAHGQKVAFRGQEGN